MEFRYYSNNFLAQFDDLQVAHLGAVDGEAYQGAHLLPALSAGSAGIDMQHAEALVIHHS